MKKVFFVLWLSFPLLMRAQTTFGNLGTDDSGGSGYKTVGANSNIVVSNIMTNDGTEMYHSATSAEGYTSTFTIKAIGGSIQQFSFTDMQFRGYVAFTVDAAHSSIVFKDKDGVTLQTMTLNSDKPITTSSTSIVSFFDNGNTVPIYNVAEIIVSVYYNSAQANQQNSANFDFPSITISDYALPVELTSFTASTVENKVTLNWNTAAEVNNYGFNVERNTPLGLLSRGEVAWEKIAFVQGHGNSNSPKSYSFVDENPVAGTVQYRLKQIDSDGKFEYGDIVEVNVAPPASFTVKQNFPNPFNPSTTIKYELPANNFVTVKVFDVIGREVTTLINGNETAGIHQVRFDGTNLPSGMYVYKVQAGNYTQIKKMLLAK